jgi:hypothetical protein
MATNTTRAMWKRKSLAGYIIPKIQNLTLCLIASEMEDSVHNLPMASGGMHNGHP